MIDHRVWVFIHVMLLVYWLGGDLGVFVLARAAKRPELSFAERAFALKMAVTIDLVPRLCFTVMFPVGLHVAASGGWLQVPAWAFLVAGRSPPAGSRCCWRSGATKASRSRGDAEQASISPSRP